MNSISKAATVTVFVAAVATAASAQQRNERRQPQQLPPASGYQGHMMGQGGMMGHGMMMDDPRMQAEMIGMMRSCGRMMEYMPDMPRSQRRPRG